MPSWVALVLFAIAIGWLLASLFRALFRVSRQSGLRQSAMALGLVVASIIAAIILREDELAAQRREMAAAGVSTVAELNAKRYAEIREARLRQELAEAGVSTPAELEAKRAADRAAEKVRSEREAAEKAARDRERAAVEAKAAAEKEAARIRNCEGSGGADMAFVMSQKVIRARLKAPSSASFPWSTDRGVEFGPRKGGKPCEFVVRAWVDAINSFNAKIRSRYSVVMTYNMSSGTWSGSNVVIDE